MRYRRTLGSGRKGSRLLTAARMRSRSAHSRGHSAWSDALVCTTLSNTLRCNTHLLLGRLDQLADRLERWMRRVAWKVSGETAAADARMSWKSSDSDVVM